MMHRQPRARHTLIIVAVGFFVATACARDKPFDVIPAGAIVLSPSPSYAVWWKEMEQCSGLTGNIANVSWYQIPGVPSFRDPNGLSVYALWSLTYNSITIAGGHIDDAQVVRHEILHVLLQAHGHPTEYFVTKCGSLLGPNTG